MKIVFIINSLFIAAFLAVFVWAGLALGNREEFQSRMSIVFMLQGICLVFMVIRRALRRAVHEKGSNG